MRMIQELMSLEGRVAIVTGGAGYIGSAFCEALAEVGANLVVLDIEPEKCDSTATSIASKYGIETLSINIDLADEQQLSSVHERVLDRFGRIDILVNCAAVVGTSNLKGLNNDFIDQQSHTWRHVIEVNLNAIFVLTQICVPSLKASGKGSIINISSIYGVVGPDMRLYRGTSMGNSAAHSVSKGGLLQFTRWLATVLAPEIRVNAITPGGVWRNQNKRFVKRYIDQTPLNRMAKEEDLKGAIVYLASDMSAYVTGQNILVDGGWTAW
ncbi:SDR family oxidoreductase [Thermodesulfobacteriota bacterium]